MGFAAAMRMTRALDLGVDRCRLGSAGRTAGSSTRLPCDLIKVSERAV